MQWKRGERASTGGSNVLAWTLQGVWVGSAAQQAGAARANSRLFLVCPPTLPARKSGVGRRQGFTGPWVVDWGGKGSGRKLGRVRVSPEAPSF